MIDVKEIGKQIGEQIVKEPMICWYPGGFKPPHKGHFAAAQQLAAKPYITQVNVLIGQGIRDGITAEQSKAIWDIYLKAQPNPKIKVSISQTKSPIRDIYRWFADDLERKAYVAAAGKEATDLKYFENLKEAFGDRVFEEIINDEFVDQDGERVSGTEFRATINRLKETYNAVKANPEDKRALNDYNTTYNYFKSLFPESVIQKGYFDEIQKVLGINYPPPTSLQEDSQPNPKDQPKWVWLEYKNKEKLNPLVFDEDETIDEKVKELLLKIANYFWENLEIPEPFEDVVLIGSSANYNYTPTSDIDVHIIVDFNKFKDPELVKKYFDKAKANWNKVHDLKLGKHNIELYVQDKNEEKTADAGIYSLMNDKWIYKPTYKPINIPNKDIEQKTKLFKQQINKLVKQGKDNPEQSIELINKIKERIKNFRQAGLDKAGEYSIENLAFKNLRNTGYLKKLSDLKNQLIDKSLSLTESVNKNSLFNNFMSYACNELQIQTPPTLEIKHMVGEEQPSFGAYLPSDHHIFLNPIGRNIVDVLRTLAHELVHAKQNELGILTPTSGETGSEHENDANAIAGILMRDYGKQNPNIYNIGVLQEQVTKTSVICDKCGWSWKKKDGGKDLYVCHKCGHDNNPRLNEESNPLKLNYVNTWHKAQKKALENKTEEAIKLMIQAAKEAEELESIGEANYYKGTIAWLKKDYNTVNKYINDKFVKSTGNDEVLKRLLNNKDKSYKEAYISKLNESKYSSLLSQMSNKDQLERNEYQKFVQNKFNGDYNKGAKEFAKIKNRKENNIFGDKERLEKFIKINFDFDNFNEKDWDNYWLLTQHSDFYPEFQKKSLDIIEKYLGKDNENYKYLYDRISCSENGTQKYGTQNICERRNTLNEVKKNLNENVAGIDSFLNKTIQKFPETEKYKDTIEKFIESSGVKKIELSNFSFGYDNALGLSLHDGVLLNNKIFNLNLPTFLYVVFHELAHQYQFKKYGDDKMYDLYKGKIDVKEAAAAMKNIELVADEFAIRKIREFIKLGLLNKEDEIKSSAYKNIPLSHFEQLINLFAEKLKTKGAKNPDEISDVIYNMVKANLIKNVFDKIKGMLQESKKDKQPITRIYFDLDGVLAGFDNQFKKYNEDGLNFKSYIREYGSNKAWDIINKAKTKFWSEMPWNPGGKELYNRVMELAKEKNIEVWILSSPGLDPNGDAKRGKDEWVDKHLNIPKNRRVYKQAKDKHTEAKPGYMLIDDMGKNVSEFINAGGTGIKNNPEDSTESIKKLYKFKYE